MRGKPYLVFSGGVFGVVAIGHLLRLVLRWPVRVGIWEIPEWVSYVALPLAVGMCVWAFRLARR